MKDKVAIVVGAGSSGPGWGNGKCTAVTFAREGAKVMPLRQVYGYGLREHVDRVRSDAMHVLAQPFLEGESRRADRHGDKAGVEP